ncbi:hypothetical protein [Nannocystis pusilla]
MEAMDREGLADEAFLLADLDVPEVDEVAVDDELPAPGARA